MSSLGMCKRSQKGISARFFNNSRVGSGSAVSVTPTSPEEGMDTPEKLCQCEIRKRPASSAIKLQDPHCDSRNISIIQNKYIWPKHNQKQRPRQFPTLRMKTRLQGCGKSLGIQGCDGNHPPASNKARISRSAASTAVANMYLRKDSPSSRGSGFTITIWSLSVPTKSGYHRYIQFSTIRRIRMQRQPTFQQVLKVPPQARPHVFLFFSERHTIRNRLASRSKTLRFRRSHCDLAKAAIGPHIHFLLSQLGLRHTVLKRVP